MPHSALLKQTISKTYPTVSHGKGVFLYDTDGKRYLDGSSGAMTASLGHGLRPVVEAMNAQAERVAFSYRTQFTNEPAEALARRLADLAPGDLNWVCFVNSGSEASELAVRAAVTHWRHKAQPGKVKVLGRRNSYHGMTLGALSLSGDAARRPDYGSLLHPFPVAPPAYWYRYAQPGESELAYAERAAAEFEHAVLAEGVDTVAAIIVEPIVGAAGGVLVPPPGYLARLREMCDRLGILMIVDEVITGMGRTGAWFASAAEGVVADILLTGKGLSAGYAPVGAVVLRDHLVAAMEASGGLAPFGHTFSGNPLGAAACVAVLDFIDAEDVLENVTTRAEELEAGLHELARRHPAMADVRGRGLLWGFEFVLDQASKQAPDPRHNATALFVDECFARGLIVYPAGIAPLNNATIISPPLTITADEVQQLLGLLDDALTAMDRHADEWRLADAEALSAV